MWVGDVRFDKSYQISHEQDQLLLNLTHFNQDEIHLNFTFNDTSVHYVSVLTTAFTGRSTFSDIAFYTFSKIISSFLQA